MFISTATLVGLIIAFYVIQGWNELDREQEAKRESFREYAEKFAARERKEPLPGSKVYADAELHRLRHAPGSKF